MRFSNWETMSQESKNLNDLCPGTDSNRHAPLLEAQDFKSHNRLNRLVISSSYKSKTSPNACATPLEGCFFDHLAGAGKVIGEGAA